MNQENIDRKITVGDLVEVLYQNRPIYGLVLSVSFECRYPDRQNPKYSKMKDSVAFITIFTRSGLKKYPMSWCAPIL